VICLIVRGFASIVVKSGRSRSIGILFCFSLKVDIYVIDVVTEIAICFDLVDDISVLIADFNSRVDLICFNYCLTCWESGQNG
jgi:hypothetical protein